MERIKVSSANAAFVHVACFIHAGYKHVNMSGIKMLR